MKLKKRKVYNVSVSSTICQECETCFTEERQTANDACNELQTSVPFKGSQRRLGSLKQRQKKKHSTKDDQMSETTAFDSKPISNLTTLLDLCVLNISPLQLNVCLKRVRINRILETRHSILEISLPEQVRLKHLVGTN